MYQNILQYYIDGKDKEDDNESFRVWNLTKWLLEANLEFRNHYQDSAAKTKTHSRVENFKPRVKRYVEELVNMGLIRQIGTAKETKGTGTVDIFQFTIIGRVVAWIVESLNPAKREYAVNGLYNLLQSHYQPIENHQMPLHTQWALSFCQDIQPVCGFLLLWEPYH